MKMFNLSYLFAVFGYEYHHPTMIWGCFDQFNIISLKFTGVRYSRKMLESDSAVVIHLIKLDEINRTIKLLRQTLTPYCLPLPDT